MNIEKGWKEEGSIVEDKDDLEQAWQAVTQTWTSTLAHMFNFYVERPAMVTMLALLYLIVIIVLAVCWH